jgi:RNA polymerase sigma factor (sigma-70 family)
MSNHLHDGEILRIFQVPETSERAFSALMIKYQERLYWHIRRMVIDHEDASDVLQNTWIRAWKGLENFRQDAQLYTWLYRIATNECLSFLEQKKKRASVNMEENAGLMTEKLMAEDGFNPQKLEWKLQLAVQQLPERQKLVFNLRYFDEMPYEEMSRVLGTSVGALKASYHHAVKKVEKYLIEL